MGITNFVSRPFAGIATVVTEYTKNPLMYVIVFASSSLFVLDSIQELEEEKSDKNSENKIEDFEAA